MEFIYKKLCIYSYMFKLTHLQSTLHLVKYTYWDIFPTASNSFWTHQFWCLLVLLTFFVSPIPHKQNVSLWEIFSSGETKKVTQGKIRWIGRVGAWGSWIFGQKLLDTSVMWVSLLINYLSWNGQTHWKSLQKNSLKLNASSHNTTSWLTDTDGSLEHSPSGGSLYY